VDEDVDEDGVEPCRQGAALVLYLIKLRHSPFATTGRSSRKLGDDLMARQTKTKSRSRTAPELLRQLALDCALGGSDPPGTLRKLRASLTELIAAFQDVKLQNQARLVLKSLGVEGSSDELVGLAQIGARIDQMQAQSSAVAEAAPLAPASILPPVPLPPIAPERAVRAAPSEPPVARDAEMVELFSDFAAETMEGLDRVDAFLLAGEQSAIDSEQINALFRVFHTIKGVSGFLSVAEVTRLAHVTEALLDQVRQGNLDLVGDALDAVFESSSAMRQTVEALRLTVAQGLPDPTNPLLPTLIARIERASSQREATVQGATVPEPVPASAGQSEPSESDDDASSAKPDPAVVEGRPPAALAGAPGHPPARVRDTVKVDLERVDSIVEMVGELIIVESMVVNSPELTNASTAKLRNYLTQMSKISRDLQNATMRMRMVPVAGVFRKTARLVRDLSRKTGKLVQLVLTGETTEMDRSMVERIEDPLVHMIRNAIDHAVELPDERVALGKPALATLHLSASHEGGSVAIGLSDDGRGLPREVILKKARDRGLIPDSGETLSDQEVFALIFVPGFSTAAAVTEISGRGVGMDVVKRSVEDMRGRVLVDSVRGQGTSFKLILPLTLAIIDGMLVSSGAERYIIPSLSIVEALQPTAEMVHAVGDGTELIRVRGEILPLLRLGALFSVPETQHPPEVTQCVILESAGRKLGLLVDEILTQQQVVIKPLGEGLGTLELLAGAAIMPDGRVGLILNVDRLGGLSGRRRRATNDSGEVAA
jgi:two-component system chemotaxis sensor kinase CheA